MTQNLTFVIMIRIIKIVNPIICAFLLGQTCSMSCGVVYWASKQDLGRPSRI